MYSSCLIKYTICVKAPKLDGGRPEHRTILSGKRRALRAALEDQGGFFLAARFDSGGPMRKPALQRQLL